MLRSFFDEEGEKATKQDIRKVLSGNSKDQETRV